MKIIRYIILGLLAVAVAGILCYKGFVEKNLETGDLVKGIIVLAGLVLSLFRPRIRRVSNKKALYQKAYSNFIQNPFSEDSKLEKRFYNAVDDYNRNKPAAAISKLSKLRQECQRSADVYAVTVFMALCCDDMRLYPDAIRHYQAALSLRPNSSLASNMGLCYCNAGDRENAEKAYRQAIAIDPKNAFAYNNMATLYFRDGNYATALDYAEAALEANDTMPQALSCAAVCCALMGYEAQYENYYRRAVSAGYDGKKIKDAIRSLDAKL